MEVREGSWIRDVKTCEIKRACAWSTEAGDALIGSPTNASLKKMIKKGYIKEGRAKREGAVRKRQNTEVSYDINSRITIISR